MCGVSAFKTLLSAFVKGRVYLHFDNSVIATTELRDAGFAFAELHEPGEFANKLGVPTPLFSATQPIYASTLSIGYADQDTGAVCGVLEKMAGVKRKKAKKRKT